MKQFIPEEKLGKKARRQRNLAKRGSWGTLNPVTRKPPDPKAYNRKKIRKGTDDFPAGSFYFVRLRSMRAGTPRPAAITRQAGQSMPAD